MHRLALLLPVALLVACGATASPSPSVPELASGTVSAQGMTLSVTAEPAVAEAGRPIVVEAAVTNDGTEPIIVGGPGSGIVFFSVTRLDDGLSSGPPVMEDDCTPHEFRPGQPVVVTLKKSGAFADEDPDAEFRRSFFADPELRLPPGTWSIDVTTAGVIGDQCRGEPLALEISLLVRVTE